MLRILLSSVFAIGLILSAPAEAGRKKPLTLPDPVAIPAGLDSAQIARSIKAALLTRTWTITDEQPGRIDATLHLREHVGTIYLTYDERHVWFHHVGSRQLLEGHNRRGVHVIHRNYNSWLQNVANDLGIQLELATL